MSNVSGLFKDLTTVKKARNGRLASWDQRGKNQDYWEIPAGETISLGEVEGPGCITHIWMTSSCRKVVAPSILDPVLNASAAPVMEIHPALGVIWDDYDPFYYRKVLIKITWDDQDTPSVLAPLGDFFCIGNSYPGNFSSLPLNSEVLIRSWKNWKKHWKKRMTADLPIQERKNQPGRNKKFGEEIC